MAPGQPAIGSGAAERSGNARRRTRKRALAVASIASRGTAAVAVAAVACAGPGGGGAEDTRGSTSHNAVAKRLRSPPIHYRFPYDRSDDLFFISTTSCTTQFN